MDARDVKVRSSKKRSLFSHSNVFFMFSLFFLKESPPTDHRQILFHPVLVFLYKHHACPSNTPHETESDEYFAYPT